MKERQFVVKKLRVTQDEHTSLQGLREGREMSTLRIGLLQMFGCGGDQQANLVKGDDFCRRARSMGADIALFPENLF
jgi:hypothetical protein